MATFRRMTTVTDAAVSNLVADWSTPYPWRVPSLVAIWCPRWLARQVVAALVVVGWECCIEPIVVMDSWSTMNHSHHRVVVVVVVVVAVVVVVDRVVDAIVVVAVDTAVEDRWDSLVFVAIAVVTE